MKICHHNKKRYRHAVTLIELILAILLLSTIILAGFSVELAMRRMSVKPRDDSVLRDELLPILRKIGKDFEYDAVGNYNQPSVRRFTANPCRDGSPPNYNKGLQIHVGNNQWRGYCWYADDDDRSFHFSEGGGDTEIGLNIFDFDWGGNNTQINVWIKARKNPSVAVDPFDNPEVSLNSTFAARGVSAS